MKKEESKRLSEKWTEQEKIQLKSRDEKRRLRKESPDSTSTEQKYRRNKKEKGSPKIYMIRLNPEKEVILTPAPEWIEAEGRSVRSGEDDSETEEVEVVFRGRRRDPEEEPREEIPEEAIVATEVYDSDERSKNRMGRYATEAAEEIE